MERGGDLILRMGAYNTSILGPGGFKTMGGGLKFYDTGTGRSTGRSAHCCVTEGMDTNDDDAGAHISHVDSKGTSLK